MPPLGQAMTLVDQGADILDVGGESTRPGADPVSVEEELARVIPVIRAIAHSKVAISIDTSKAEVARRAIEAGANIVNDISGLTFDPEMPAVCAAADVGVVCMHIQGTPQTMQNEPRYADVLSEIVAFFRHRLQSLEEAGIPPERIVLDPGIGFGKTAEHNLRILSNIPLFHRLERPVLIGHSRKRFLGKILRTGDCDSKAMAGGRVSSAADGPASAPTGAFPLVRPRHTVLSHRRKNDGHRRRLARAGRTARRHLTRARRAGDPRRAAGISYGSRLLSWCPAFRLPVVGAIEEQRGWATTARASLAVARFRVPGACRPRSFGVFRPIQVNLPIQYFMSPARLQSTRFLRGRHAPGTLWTRNVTRRNFKTLKRGHQHKKPAVRNERRVSCIPRRRVAPAGSSSTFAAGIKRRRG